MFEAITSWLVQTIGTLGYFGIFVLMFIESSCFIPFPSEVVMIPAGYLASKGEMNFLLVLLSGVAGSLTGAVVNYFIAYKFGRVLLLKFGKYLFFKPEHLEKIEVFFRKHGEISTFNGRLVPGVRQYISLPAGLAKMNILKFITYTTLGATIWMFVLTLLGYLIGENEALVNQYLAYIVIAAIIIVLILTIVYILFKRKK
jgi:membrane protein DedA with SNARE-associated domain